MVAAAAVDLERTIILQGSKMTDLTTFWLSQNHHQFHRAHQQNDPKLGMMMTTLIRRIKICLLSSG